MSFNHAPDVQEQGLSTVIVLNRLYDPYHPVISSFLRISVCHFKHFAQVSLSFFLEKSRNRGKNRYNITATFTIIIIDYLHFF